MSNRRGLAPPVHSILESANDRASSTDHISVTPKSLASAIENAERDGRTPLIAEVKPTSPTSGGIHVTEPVDVACKMVAGGATAISVLTEPDHFGGTLDTLRAVRDTVDVPVLRKDFVLEEAHLDAVEADVILLIARFLGEKLPRMLDAARNRGFQALVEVHDTDELRHALDAGATLIGINNRDLANLTVDLGTFETVAPDVPDDVTLIAESGIASPEDVRRMRTAGADGLLVGSAIVTGSIREQTRRLVFA